MKASELTIGAYLQHANGKYFRITRIDMWGDGSVHFACGHPHLWDYNNKFSPIPLTAEILKRNGFNMMPKDACGYDNDIWEFDTESGVCVEWRMAHGKGMTIWNDTDNDEDALVYLLPFPRYVHELQHALRLCGIDKTIEI